MILYLEVQQKAATGPAAEKHLRATQLHEPRPIPQAAPRPAPRPQQQQNQVREARAVPVDKMPDIYDLYGRDGLPISRASVQQFSLSLKLREAGETWVKARWIPEFGGYEIVEILGS
jgi:hypothetical protein